MTHTSLWILCGAIVAAAIAFKGLAAFPSNRVAQKADLIVAKLDSFQRKGPLVSPTELAFYKILVQSVGSDVAIAPKVRLADLIAPGQRLSRSGWQKDFNRLAMKHVDFVLFDQNNGAVIGVVELDDSSHSTLEAGVKDAFKNAVLNSAGIQITRFNARRSYDASEVRAKVPGRLPDQLAKSGMRAQSSLRT